MDFSDLFFSAVIKNFFESIKSVPTAAWYVLPAFFAYLTWKNWIAYVQALFIKKLEWVLLEVRLPRDVTKPPQAMEVVMAIFEQTKDGTFLERWWDGFVRPWFTLEIASLGGEIHFYVRTQKGFRNAVESQIYSQYPEAEIFETTDYTVDVPYGEEGSDWDLWAINFKLAKPDHYPIKTYIDYGLDKEMEEENKVDPLTPVLELMGSIGPGEHMWIQIPIMATRSRFRSTKSWYKKVDWKEGAKEELDKLYKRDQKIKEGEMVSLAKVTQTTEEKLASEAITRSLSKIAFDAGYRAIYLARADKFNKGMIAGLKGTIKQYGSASLNGFKAEKQVGFDYPWEDITGRRLKRIKWEFFDSYRQRSYFYDPYVVPSFVLTAEELATIYRFPGKVASTPTLGRIESKRAEPPANLPI